MKMQMVIGEDGRAGVAVVNQVKRGPAADELGRVRASGLALERALDDLERGRVGLLRPDGSPRFSEAEQGERLAVLRQPLERAVASAEQAVAAAVASADRLAALAADPDPVAWLSPDELETANSRRIFVSEDVERASLLELERRLGGVLASGDRVGQWLYHRYAGAKLGELRRAAVERDQKLPPKFGEAWALVERLSVALRPAGLAEQGRAADDLRRAAGELRMAAGRAVRDPAADAAAMRAAVRSIL